MRKFLYSFLIALVLTSGVCWARGTLLGVSHTSSSAGGDGGDGNTWQTWSGDTTGDETGWGDSANTYICWLENPAAGGNETGSGAGLAGGDLVLTQAGAISGCTATPPYRYLDGANDLFTWTTTAVEAIALNATWTLVWKVQGLSNGSAGTNLIQWYDNVTTDQLQVDCPAADGKLRITVEDGGVRVFRSTLNTAVPSGTFYIVACYDGTAISLGWATTRPTKFSEFGSGVSMAVAPGWASFDNRVGVMGETSGGPAPAGNYHYFIASKTAFINNGL